MGEVALALVEEVVEVSEPCVHLVSGREPWAWAWALW